MVWWVGTLGAYLSVLVLVALWAAAERAHSALSGTRVVMDAEPLDAGSESIQVEAP